MADHNVKNYDRGFREGWSVMLFVKMASIGLCFVV